MMNWKVLETEEDYNAATAWIVELWDCQPGTEQDHQTLQDSFPKNTSESDVIKTVTTPFNITRTYTKLEKRKVSIY